MDLSLRSKRASVPGLQLLLFRTLMQRDSGAWAAYNEIAGVGRTPWRSIGERNGVGILRLALPFRKLRVVLAQEDRGILYSTKLRYY